MGVPSAPPPTAGDVHERSESADETDSAGARDEETDDSPPRVDFGSYSLDAASRVVAPRGRLACPVDSIVHYRGTTIRYAGDVRVHRDFVPFLQRFEEAVVEIARATYGRAPQVLVHRGAFNCRRIRGIPEVMSEHAFGNALDLAGFDFYSARPSDALPEGVPSSFRRSFRVRIRDHWSVTYGDRAYHQVFFQRLRDRLLAEQDLFGVILGPSYPGHRDHLHLDRAPFRFVQF